MRRPVASWRILAVCVLMVAAGCHPTQPFYLHEDGDLSHYLDKATQTEHPDLHAAPLAEVEHADRPLTLSNPEFREFWDLTLEECVSITLANSKVLRGGTAARLQNGQIFAGTQQGALLNNSVGRVFATTYDPGIVEPLKDMQRADFHIWPLWDRIRCPVLVLRGKESDVLLASTVEEMRRRGPAVEVVEIDGVGHAPTLTDPKHVRIVRDWVLD